MSKLVPRDYQEKSSDIAVKNLKGKGKGLLVLPCGSGKTLVFSLIAKKLQSKLLVVAHSQDLVEQNYLAAVEMGVEGCAIFCDGLDSKEIGDVTFITVQSAKGNIDLFKDFDYVVIDEADQKFRAEEEGMYNKFFKDIGVKAFCGFTATPYHTKTHLEGSTIKIITRMRPKNFNDIIYHLPNQHMIDNNYWTPISFNVYEFDESLLEYNTSKTDFTDVSMKKAIDTLSVNNNCYILTKKLLNAGKSNILLYCQTLEDAEVFKKHLQDSDIISYATKPEDRERIHREFKEGKLRCLISLNTLKAGYNNKKIEYINVARVCGSIRDWVQIVGRGQRQFPGKEKCVVNDFGGNYKRFGDPQYIDINKDITGKWELYSGDNLVSGIYHNEIGNYKVISGKLIQTSSKWAIKPDESFGNYKLEKGKHKGKEIKFVKRFT